MQQVQKTVYTMFTCTGFSHVKNVQSFEEVSEETKKNRETLAKTNRYENEAKKVSFKKKQQVKA